MPQLVQDLVSTSSEDVSDRHWVKSTSAIFLEVLDVVESRVVVSGLDDRRHESVLRGSVREHKGVRSKESEHVVHRRVDKIGKLSRVRRII
jgi:hypothetical protein